VVAVLIGGWPGGNAPDRAPGLDLPTAASEVASAGACSCSCSLAAGARVGLSTGFEFLWAL